MGKHIDNYLYYLVENIKCEIYASDYFYRQFELLLCHRYSIKLTSSLYGPMSRSLPIKHLIHLNYYQSITEPKKPLVCHYSGTMCRTKNGVLSWDYISQ